MIKYFGIGILLFTFLLTSFSQNTGKNEVFSLGLQGNVKQIITISGVIKNNQFIELTEGFETNSNLQFDEKGRIVLEKNWQKLSRIATDTNYTSYFYKDSLLIESKANIYRKIFNYNKRGYLTQVLSYNDKKQLESEFSYVYNSKNKLIKETENYIQQNNKITIKTKYKKSLKVSETKSSNIEIKKTHFKYDKRNRLIQQIKIIKICNPKNFQEPVKKYQYFYAYDSNDSIIEFISSQGTKENYAFKENYSFDIDGRILTKLSYCSFTKKISDSISFEYNEMTITKRHFNQNNIITTTKTERDKNGKMLDYLHIYHHEEFGFKVHEVYKYDDNGNWIEKITYKNDVIEQYTKRVIEYY